MKKFLFPFVLIASLVLSACSINIDTGSTRVSGSGKSISETRPVSGFNQVAVDSAIQAEITLGDSESLTITGDDNIVPLVVSEVSGGKLSLRIKPNISTSTRQAVKAAITLKDLTGLSLNGASHAQVAAVKPAGLTVTVDGASQATLDSLEATSLSVNANGASTVRVNGGTVNSITATLDGASKLLASDVASSSASIDANGASQAQVWVKTTLKANLNGASNLKYYGQPAITQTVDGAAQLVSMGNH